MRAPVRHAEVTYVGRCDLSRLAEWLFVSRWGGPKRARDPSSLSNPTHFARLITYGTPEEIAECRASYTGMFLADLLHKEDCLETSLSAPSRHATTSHGLLPFGSSPAAIPASVPPGLCERIARAQPGRGKVLEEIAMCG